jgi:hypothetical protein
MAAISTTTTTEKTPLNGSVADRGNVAYTRTFTWTAGNGETAGTAATTFTLPANTAVVAGWHKSDQDWGGTTTIAYRVGSSNVFATAAILNETAGTWKALTVPVTSAYAVPAQGTDTVVTVVIAAAATPAVTKTTTTVTLLLVPVGASEATYSTYTS